MLLPLSFVFPEPATFGHIHKTLFWYLLNFQEDTKVILPFSESSLKVKSTAAFPLASTVNPCFSNKAGLPSLSFWAVTIDCGEQSFSFTNKTVPSLLFYSLPFAIQVLLSRCQASSSCRFILFGFSSRPVFLSFHTWNSVCNLESILVELVKRVSLRFQHNLFLVNTWPWFSVSKIPLPLAIPVFLGNQPFGHLLRMVPAKSTVVLTIDSISFW